MPARPVFTKCGRFGLVAKCKPLLHWFFI
jgi:hypothetical protein